MTEMTTGGAGSTRRTIRLVLLGVAVVVLLGMLSARISDSGYGNPWFDALTKPAIMPPGWAFPAVWSLLYVLMGIALGLVLAAPRSALRTVALILFAVQLALNLGWSPVFFSLHRIMLAFGLIIAIFLWALATTAAFWKIRPLAGALMLPYLAWLVFAGILNWQIHVLNPNGLTLVPSRGDAQIIIQ